MSAPALVLIRGLLREQRHWLPFSEQLRRQCPDTPLFTPDLAGNGVRYRERSPADIGAMVADLRRQLPATPGRRHWLVALSMGGMIATEWARRHPDEVAGLVLINTSFANLSPPWQRLNPRWWPALLGGFLRPLPPGAREQRVLTMTSNRHRDDAALLQRWTRYAESCPVSRRNVLHQLTAAARYRAPAAPPVANVLLLSGLGDRLVDPACSAAIAARWQVPLRSHPTAGHDLPLDTPAWLLEVLGEVVGEAPPSPERGTTRA